jgi:tetratricopeptide (TPR) repeat protein
VPETILETEKGQQGKAKQLKWLTFPQPAAPVPNDGVSSVSSGQSGSVFATQTGNLIRNLFLLLLNYLARTLIQKLIRNLFLAYLAVITLLVFTPALTLGGGIVLSIIGYIGYRIVLGVAAVMFPDLFEPVEIRPLLELARQGGAEAKEKLGQYYYEQGEAHSSKKEYKEAINCYEKAAKYGLDYAKWKSAECWYRLAQVYRTKEQNKKHYDCVRKAAEAGYAMANLYMGDYYLYGRVCPMIFPDRNIAVTYWQKAISLAAEQGNIGLNADASNTAYQRLEEMAAAREQEVIAKRQAAMRG